MRPLVGLAVNGGSNQDMLACSDLARGVSDDCSRVNLLDDLGERRPRLRFRHGAHCGSASRLTSLRGVASSCTCCTRKCLGQGGIRHPNLFAPAPGTNTCFCRIRTTFGPFGPTRAEIGGSIWEHERKWHRVFSQRRPRETDTDVPRTNADVRRPMSRLTGDCCRL